MAGKTIEILKDKIILVMASMMAAVFLSLASWTLYTVYKNSTMITSLLEKKEADTKQWDFITINKDEISDIKERLAKAGINK